MAHSGESFHNNSQVVSSSPDLLSPGGKSRYGRTRRPKITQDFFNIDDVVFDENPAPRHSPVKSPKLKLPLKAPIISEEVICDIKDEFTKIDDLGMKVANNFKTNLQRGLDDTIKERKFFKSLPESKMEVPNVVDVTKVFKIISTKPTASSEVQENKAASKSALKTYSNKRKHVHDGDSFIIESFGLPDEPIVPVSSPFMFERDTKIDIDIGCEDDVNLVNPWMFDEFGPLTLYASEPITPIDDVGLTQGSALDLFSCDSLLSDSVTNIDKILDPRSSSQDNENFVKSKVVDQVSENRIGSVSVDDENNTKIEKKALRNLTQAREEKDDLDNKKSEVGTIKRTLRSSTGSEEKRKIDVVKDDTLPEVKKSTKNKKFRSPADSEEERNAVAEVKTSPRTKTLRKVATATDKNEDKIDTLPREKDKNAATMETEKSTLKNSIEDKVTIEKKEVGSKKGRKKKVLKSSAVSEDKKHDNDATENKNTSLRSSAVAEDKGKMEDKKEYNHAAENKNNSLRSSTVLEDKSQIEDKKEDNHATEKKNKSNRRSQDKSKIQDKKEDNHVVEVKNWPLKSSAGSEDECKTEDKSRNIAFKKTLRSTTKSEDKNDNLNEIKNRRSTLRSSVQPEETKGRKKSVRSSAESEEDEVMKESLNNNNNIKKKILGLVQPEASKIIDEKDDVKSKPKTAVPTETRRRTLRSSVQTDDSKIVQDNDTAKNILGDSFESEILAYVIVKEAAQCQNTNEKTFPNCVELAETTEFVVVHEEDSDTKEISATTKRTLRSSDNKTSQSVEKKVVGNGGKTFLNIEAVEISSENENSINDTSKDISEKKVKDKKRSNKNSTETEETTSENENSLIDASKDNLPKKGKGRKRFSKEQEYVTNENILNDTSKDISSKKEKARKKSVKNSTEILEISSENENSLNDMSKVIPDKKEKGKKRSIKSSTEILEISSEHDSNVNNASQDIPEKKDKGKKRSLKSSAEISENEIDTTDTSKSDQKEKESSDNRQIKKVVKHLKKKPKIDEENLKSKNDSSKTEHQQTSPSKSSKIKKTPSPSKAKSQIVNPAKLNKIMHGPQVRILLNPLSCVSQTHTGALVPNPFKIQTKEYNQFKKEIHKLRSPEDKSNSISYSFVNKYNLLKKADSSTEEIKVEPEELEDLKNIKPENIEFQVGDLTWAKMGTHPYWPCMITQEPESGQHKKIIANRSTPLYHVRFFGDKGRRSWVSSQMVMLYFGRDDLDRLAKVLKAEDKIKTSYINETCTVKPKKLPKWQTGVNEAESLKNKSVTERLNYFFEMFASKREKLQKIKRLGINPEAFKRKRVSDTSDVVSKKAKKNLVDSEKEEEKKTVEDLKVNESSSKKGPSSTKPKKSSEVIESTSKSPDSSKKQDSEGAVITVKDDSSDEDMPLAMQIKPSKEDEATKDSQKVDEEIVKESHQTPVNKETPETRKKFLKKEQFSEKSLEARKKLRNSQIKITTIDTLLPPPEPLEAKRSKRNSTEDNEAPEDDVTPKARNKRHQIPGEYSNSDTDSKFSDNSSVPASLESQAALYRRNNIFRGISKEKVCQICEKNAEVFKCKGPCNGVYHYKCAVVSIKTEEEKNKEIVESNVEIISVNSKQPLPNLSDSPNYKGMTLAEKIDFRMKEIMKKFDYQSVYGESTDSSSEEYTLDDKNSSKLSLTVTDKPTNKEVPIIKHVTADNVSYICVTDEKPKTKELENVIRETSKCCWCLNDETPLCLICGKEEAKSGSKFRQKCSLHQCGKFYHPDCLKLWPQTQWSLIQSTKDKMSDEKYDTFVCPRHVCHTCISDDPRASNSRCPSDKVVKCLKCPATYHSSSYCVPAGSHILSSTQIVCPRHYSKVKKRVVQTINTNWCFICSKGGNLICCETCPTSVHVECLPGDLTEHDHDDTFYCEDCQSGRLPLYDEIVWVKLGSFRWWPALILFPNEVPDNVRNIAHNKGEFVVKFFGTYDHYWVGRGRTFLFQEGDTGHSHSVKKRVDNAFVKAIEEAAAAHQLKKQFKLNKVAEKNNGLKPPPYIRIKVNKPVGNVRFGDGNESNTTSCECDPNQPHPCGPDSDCLNRLLLTECNPEVCPAGERCNNQCFEKREYPPLIPHRTHARGWGLKTLAPIRKGQFVIEYVGEVIDEQEYQRRIQKMHEQKEENYYFLTIDNNRTLDAGPKGNVARFMNHSCQPNCETQKWTVNGDTRVGLFAKCDIPADTELTFNYNLECIGKEKKMCKCGAPNCSGFIGVKVKSDVPQKKSTKPKKKKTPPPPEVVKNDDPCFICGQVGDVVGCNNKICTKYYHLRCVGMKSWPEGNKWVCQWHTCNICAKRTIRCCVKCVNSYCPSHSEGFIRYDKLLGFVCFEHDPTKENNTIQTAELPPKTSSAIVNTEETAVTSTTPDDMVTTETKHTEDDIDDEVDSLNLNVRLNGCMTSTPVKKSKEDSSLDESAVSSASTSDVTNKNIKKKKKLTKKTIVKKKVEVQVKNTANLFNTVQNEVKLTKFTPTKYLRTSRNSTKVLNRTDPEKDLPIRKRTRLRCGNTL